MTDEYHVHEISLGFSHDKAMLTDFLSRHHLRFEEDIEAAYGVFDEEESLLGCIGCVAL